MLDVPSAIIMLAVPYTIVSVPAGIFNLKVFQAVHGTKCIGLNILKAFASLYDTTFARKPAYGKFTMFNMMLLTYLPLSVFRVVSTALMSLVPVLVVYSSLVMIACIAVYCILYIINCVDFYRMLNCRLIMTLYSVVMAPIGYCMLSTQVLGYFRSVEDAVSGRFGG